MSFVPSETAQPDPASRFRRSPAQLADPQLAWDRPDREFFAAGACHILAMQFIERWPDSGFEMFHIRPTSSDRGHHVYVSDGEWAFDFNGWSREDDLLRANADACRHEDSTWDYERVAITGDAIGYFTKQGHRLPDDFPGDVLARAAGFLSRYETPRP